MDSIAQVSHVSVTRRELFEFLKTKGPIRPRSARSISQLIEYVLKAGFDKNECPADLKNEISTKIKAFTNLLEKYWRKSSKKFSFMENKYSEWLSVNINFGDSSQTNLDKTSRGRPSKLFVDSSDKTKTKKVQKLVSTFSAEEITHAAALTLAKRGKRNNAYLVRQSAASTPRRAKRAKRIFTSPHTSPNKIIKYTPEEALDLVVRMDLSKQSYQIMREGLKVKGANIYPSYNQVREEKKKCYPENICVNNMSAKIQLQSLLDHTTKRILKVQEAVLESHLNDVVPGSLKLIYKWGIDGSSSQSIYKQRWHSNTEEQSSDEENADEENAFITSLVPIQLFGISTKNEKENIILWQNPRPSSTRFCRPIKFQFKKETTELTQTEVADIEHQIKRLTPTLVPFNGENIAINNEMVFTMIDGKVCNAVTETSSQACYICGATPKLMNQLNKANLPKPEMYKFGLSTLHAWIRFFECILHIAYRLEVKRWQMRSKIDKEKFKVRKEHIQKEFKKRMFLNVDRPKQGSGNSNDGNTARKFFSDPELSSSITGVDVNLITRFSVILRTLSCGYNIDVTKFKEYTEATANLYVQLYDWYYMPASVHKILIHGAEVIKSALLPIGQLSEEAMEARNKHFRQYREHHTRKMSRINTNEDLLHALLVSSDPLISSLAPKIPRKSSPLPSEIIELLLPSNITANEEDVDESD